MSSVCAGIIGYFLVSGLIAATAALNEIIGHSLDSCTVNLTSYLRVMILMDQIVVMGTFVLLVTEFRFIRDFSEEFDTSITLQMLSLQYVIVHVLFPCVMLVMLLLWPRSCSQPISGWYKGYYWTLFGLEALIGFIAFCFFIGIGLEDIQELIEEHNDLHSKLQVYSKYAKKLKYHPDRMEIYRQFVNTAPGANEHHLTLIELDMFKTYATYCVNTQEMEALKDLGRVCFVCQMEM